MRRYVSEFKTLSNDKITVENAVNQHTGRNNFFTAFVIKPTSVSESATATSAMLWSPDSSQILIPIKTSKYENK